MEDPVDIKFRINYDELDGQSKKVVNSILGIGNSSKEALNESKAQLDAQKQYLSDLEQQYKAAKAAFDKVNVGTQDPAILAERQKASKLFNELKTELEGERKALEALEAQHKKLSQEEEKHNKSQNTYMTQIRQITNEMTKLDLAGKKETEYYQYLKAKLEELGTAYRRANQEKKALTTGGTTFAGISSSITGISGAFSAATGVVSLFVKNNENLVKIQTKLQSAMAITMGLQALSNTLHATSAFRITTVTQVTKLWTAATNGLTKALFGSQVAATLLMAALTLGLSVVIVNGINLLNKYIDKQRKAAEEQKKFNDSLASSASVLLAGFEKLRKKYQELGSAMDDKQKFIMQNREEMRKLGVEVNNVTDADNLFIKNAEAFKQSIIVRAKSLAAMEIASEKYKIALQKQEDASTRENNPNIKDKIMGANSFESRGEKNVLLNSEAVKAANKMRNEAEKADREAAAYIDNFLVLSEEEKKILKDANFKTLEDIKQGTKAWWEAYKKQQDDLLSEFTESEIGSKKWNAVKAEQEKATLMLEKWDKTTSSKQVENEHQKRVNAEQKLNEELRRIALEKYKFDLDMRQKEIDLMDDSFAKRSAQIQLDYEKELQAAREFTEKKLKEQQEIEKQSYIKTRGSDAGFSPVSTTVAALPENVQDDIKKLYSAAESALKKGNELLSRDIKEFSTEQGMRLASSLEQELNNIEQYYKERLQHAAGNEELIAKLIADKEKEITDVQIRNKIDVLDFENEISARRMAITDKFYLFAADREKDLLNEQKKSLKERLKLMQEQFDNKPTVELDNSLKDVEKEIDEIDKSIKNLDAKKFQEISDYVSQIATGLGDLLGEIFDDEDLSKLAGWLSDAAEGAADIAVGIASGDPKAIVDGVMKIAGVVKDVINANKEANKEIKEFNENLANMAVQYSILLISALKDVKSVNDSIFSTDTSSALTNAMKGYNTALIKEDELMRKLGDTTVKTGVQKKKFLGITYGTKDVYENLLKKYPELIKADGELNRELADMLLKSGNLSKEAQSAIENIIAAGDAAKEAIDSVNNILSDLAGLIGDDLRNSLVDAFKNGTNAAEEFGKSVSKIMEDMISNMIFNAVFGRMLGDLEKRMKESFDEGGDSDLSDDIAWFFNAYPDLVDKFNSELSDAQKKMKEQFGINTFSRDSDQSATTGAIKSVTQDSFEIWLGQFTAIRIHTSNIYDLMLGMVKDNELVRGCLFRIEENTRISADCLKVIVYFSRKWDAEGMKVA
jgi:hypothetical protein